MVPGKHEPSRHYHQKSGRESRLDPEKIMMKGMLVEMILAPAAILSHSIIGVLTRF